MSFYVRMSRQSLRFHNQMVLRISSILDFKRNSLLTHDLMLDCAETMQLQTVSSLHTDNGVSLLQCTGRNILFSSVHLYNIKT